MTHDSSAPLTDADYDKLAALEAERGRIQADGFMAELCERGLLSKEAMSTPDGLKSLGRTPKPAAGPGLGSRISQAATAGMAGASKAVGNAAQHVKGNKAAYGVLGASTALMAGGAMMAGKKRRAEGAALGPGGVALKNRFSKEAEVDPGLGGYYDAARRAKQAIPEAANTLGSRLREAGGAARAAGSRAATHVSANRLAYGGGTAALLAAGGGAALYKSRKNQMSKSATLRLPQNASSAGGFGARARAAAGAAGRAAGAAGRSAGRHIAAHPVAYGGIAGGTAAMAGLAAYGVKRHQNKTAGALDSIKDHAGRFNRNHTLISNPTRSDEFRNLSGSQQKAVLKAAHPGRRGFFSGGTDTLPTTVAGVVGGTASGRNARDRALNDLSSGRTTVADERDIRHSANSGVRGFVGGTLGSMLGQGVSDAVGGRVPMLAPAIGGMVGTAAGLYSADHTKNKRRVQLSGRDQMAKSASSILSDYTS